LQQALRFGVRDFDSFFRRVHCEAATISASGHTRLRDSPMPTADLRLFGTSEKTVSALSEISDSRLNRALPCVNVWEWRVSLPPSPLHLARISRRSGFSCSLSDCLSIDLPRQFVHKL
jgi:hypothetical protein